MHKCQLQSREAPLLCATNYPSGKCHYIMSHVNRLKSVAYAQRKRTHHERSRSVLSNFGPGSIHRACFGCLPPHTHLIQAISSSASREKPDNHLDRLNRVCWRKETSKRCEIVAPPTPFFKKMGTHFLKRYCRHFQLEAIFNHTTSPIGVQKSHSIEFDSTVA